MNYITTTELRTRSSELIALLKSGESVNLVHRSKLIGEITPKDQRTKRFDAKKVEKIVNDLNLKPLSDREIERRYRAHIMKQYGKNLPRHK